MIEVPIGCETQVTETGQPKSEKSINKPLADENPLTSRFFVQNSTGRAPLTQLKRNFYVPTKVTYTKQAYTRSLEDKFRDRRLVKDQVQEEFSPPAPTKVTDTKLAYTRSLEDKLRDRRLLKHQVQEEFSSSVPKFSSESKKAKIDKSADTKAQLDQHMLVTKAQKRKYEEHTENRGFEEKCFEMLCQILEKLNLASRVLRKIDKHLQLKSTQLDFDFDLPLTTLEDVKKCADFLKLQTNFDDFVSSCLSCLS